MPFQIELTEVYANLTGAWILAVAGATAFLQMSRAYLALQRRIRYRSPFAASLLHSPGCDRRAQLRRRVRETHALAAAVALLPLLFGTALLAGPGELVAASPMWHWLAILLVVTAIAGYHCYTLMRCLIVLPAMRYDLSADMAVSQGLQRIARRDFTVFHDVPLGGEKLAKVIVGKQGVFALSLCVQRRPSSGAKEPHTATFDGRGVRFPDGGSADVVHQAQKLATLAATRFARAAGTSIKVHPVLAIPGWRIECVEQPEFPVVNECNIDMIVSWLRPEESLLDEEYEEIVALLSAACRDARYRHTDSVEHGSTATSQVPVHY